MTILAGGGQEEGEDWGLQQLHPQTTWLWGGQRGGQDGVRVWVQLRDRQPVRVRLTSTRACLGGGGGEGDCPSGGEEELLGKEGEGELPGRGEQGRAGSSRQSQGQVGRGEGEEEA